MRLLIVLTGLVVFFAASHSSARPVAPALATMSTTPARGVSCTAAATKALIRRFVNGYNSGRVVAIDRLWAPEPRFQWFSAGSPGQRLGRRAYQRATLAAYFRSRVLVHERIRVVAMRAGYDPNRGIVNFNGKLRRSADDLRPRLLDFKGAADCAVGQPVLIVWSM